MMRIVLFLATNLAVLLIASVTLKLLGVDRFTGQNYGSLLAFCAAANNCYPWRLGIGGPNYLAQKSAIEAQSPTFLHTSDPAVASGSSTLEVSGDLNVAGQALPLVNPPGNDDAVGLTVGGSFKQGSAGLFDSVGGQGSCGMLGPSFPWNVKGARIIDSNDTAGVPECGAVVNTSIAVSATPMSLVSLYWPFISSSRLTIGQLPLASLEQVGPDDPACRVCLNDWVARREVTSFHSLRSIRAPVCGGQISGPHPRSRIPR